MFDFVDETYQPITNMFLSNCRLTHGKAVIGRLNYVKKVLAKNEGKVRFGGWSSLCFFEKKYFCGTFSALIYVHS